MAQIEESVARYLEQLDTADRQEPSEAFTTKTNRLKEKIETLKQQMRRLERLKVEMLATPDQQISLTDPDARSMATSGHGSGIVGYNVQIAVEANHHLIVMHEVTNDGTDRSQLSHVANETKTALGAPHPILPQIARESYRGNQSRRCVFTQAGSEGEMAAPIWEVCNSSESGPCTKRFMSKRPRRFALPQAAQRRRHCRACARSAR